MVKRLRYLFLLLTLFSFAPLSAQLLDKDTTMPGPFFAAKKFNSKFFIGFEAQVTQILRKEAAMVTAFSANWLINHQIYLGAKYGMLTSRESAGKILQTPDSLTVYVQHRYAMLTSGYILFHDKKISFNPELSAGWAQGEYTSPERRNFKLNFGIIQPAAYAVFNAAKNVRIGLGGGYRAVIGNKLGALRSNDLGGAYGTLFLRLGTF